MKVLLACTLALVGSGAVWAQPEPLGSPPGPGAAPIPAPIGIEGQGLRDRRISSGPIGYPGSTWGGLMYPSGLIGDEKHNTLLQGKVEQGVNWFRFGEDKWIFNTYASLNYSIDSKGLSYNNKITPALGLKVQRAFGSGIVDVGIQVIGEHRWKEKSDKTNTGVQAYTSWWFGWDLKK